MNIEQNIVMAQIGISNYICGTNILRYIYILCSNSQYISDLWWPIIGDRWVMSWIWHFYLFYNHCQDTNTNYSYWIPYIYHWYTSPHRYLHVHIGDKMTFIVSCYWNTTLYTLLHATEHFMHATEQSSTRHRAKQRILHLTQHSPFSPVFLLII